MWVTADSDGAFIRWQKCKFRALIGNEAGLKSGGVAKTPAATAPTRRPRSGRITWQGCSNARGYDNPHSRRRQFGLADECYGGEQVHKKAIFIAEAYTTIAALLRVSSQGLFITPL
jgi:hypothetical protein